MGGKHKEEVSGLVKNTGVMFHSRTADAPDKAVLSKRAQDAQVVGLVLRFLFCFFLELIFFDICSVTGRADRTDFTQRIF